MTHDSRSLSTRHASRFDVPAAIVLAGGLLVAGYTLPFMEVQKLVFFREDYSLLRSIVGMWEEGYYFLAIVIFVFSVVFPIGKLAALLMVWFMPMPPERLARALHWLGVLGKWSMLDVFVIALLIVLTRAGSLVEATPGVGVYLFAAAILLSMIATVLIDQVVKRERG